MTTLWIVVTLAVLAALLARYLVGRPLLEGSMLAFGLAFYCLLPFLVYGAGLYAEGPGEGIWSAEFESLHQAGPAVGGLMLLLVLSFLAGHAMPAPVLGRYLNRPIAVPVLRLSAVLVGLLALVFAFQARDSLWAGYSGDYRPDLMGPMATVNLVTTLLLLNALQWQQCRAAKRGLGLLLLLNSVALLSMGGRMYVLIALVCLFLQRINTRSRRPLARLRLLVFSAAAILCLASVGLWRLSADFEGSLLLTTALAEPVLTSISMASYFACGEMPLLAVPYNFLGSVVNLVPSALLADKDALMPTLDPAGNCMVSPFGATHIGPALLVNFGVVGAACFLFGFAWLLKSFRSVRPGGWWFHHYLCGLLPFMFFRDGFLIFNKAFTTGLLIAAVLLCLQQHRRGRAAAAVPALSN